MKNPFRKKEPRRALRVRAQHRDLDNAAIEGLWVGDYNGYLHLRAAKTMVAGEREPFRHDEVLIPSEKVVYLEVLGKDASPDPKVYEVGEPSE